MLWITISKWPVTERIGSGKKWKNYIYIYVERNKKEKKQRSIDLWILY